MAIRALWPVLALAVEAKQASSASRRTRLPAFLHNLHSYSAPSAGTYDALVSPLLGPFYTRVARRVSELQPLGRVLEIGPGPGHLSTKLARMAPGLRIVGLDISLDMARRARSRALRAGVANRVALRVGDVSALPFLDRSFDLAVSTFSLHHWEDPTAGLAEVFRVLRPGGVLLVYDVEDWVRRWERSGPGLAQVAPGSPFQDHGRWERQVVLRLGPAPVVFRAELRREAEPAQQLST